MLGIPPVTLSIIGLTVLTSLLAFNDPNAKMKMMFHPYSMKRNNEWYRALTSGFIHADGMHLLMNMLSLYFFGPAVEMYMKVYFGSKGMLFYILLYVICICLAEVYSYFRHQDNYGYMSLGASGAVCGVIFAAILFQPWLMIYGIVPGFVFGILFLVLSQQQARKGGDNVAHDAHFYGALVGFIFPMLLKPALFMEFIQKLANHPY